MVPAVLHWQSEYLTQILLKCSSLFVPDIFCILIIHQNFNVHPICVFLMHYFFNLLLRVLHNRPRSPSPCVYGTSTYWRERRHWAPWLTQPWSYTRVSKKKITISPVQRWTHQTSFMPRYSPSCCCYTSERSAARCLALGCLLTGWLT